MSEQPDLSSVPDVPFIEATDVPDQPDDTADQSPYADGEAQA